MVNLSVKISALYSQMNPAEPEDAIAHLAPQACVPSCAGRTRSAPSSISTWRVTLRRTPRSTFSRTLFTETEFRDWPHVGIVVQAYLRDAERDLRDLIDWGRGAGTRFAVRLVKGAYWDYEKIKARAERLALSGLSAKTGERRQFRGAAPRILLENESIVTAAFGSHNVRSIAHAMAYAEEIGVDKSRFEFQLLYGMAGPIKRALVEMGYRVREYCAGRRVASRHVVSRQAIAREHFERRIFAGEIFRQTFPPRSYCATRTN